MNDHRKPQGPMRFAVADPPYRGQAARHYRKHPDYAGEVDQEALILRLRVEYPDGWLYCLPSTELRRMLPLVPEKTRVVAWVKPFASFKPGVNPAYAWEPALLFGGRTPEGDTVRDWVSANITLRRGTHGAKPREWCRWVMDLLGVMPGDQVDDLYPGSGAVQAAIDERLGRRAPSLQRELF